MVRVFLLMATAIFMFAFSQNLKAQDVPAVNEETTVPMANPNPHWKEMFENKPAGLNNEQESVSHPVGEQINLEKLEEDKDKAQKMLLRNDARIRRETRATRAGVIEDQQKILNEGGTVNPEEQPPKVLGTARLRRQTTVNHYEAMQKLDKAKEKAVGQATQDDTNSQSSSTSDDER